MKIFCLKTKEPAKFGRFVDECNIRMMKSEIGMAFEPLTCRIFYDKEGMALIILAYRTTIPNIVPSFFLGRIIKRGLKKAGCEANFISHKKALEFLLGDAL